MTSLKQWAATVCIAAVICAILELLIPDKKYEKLLKPVIAAFAVYAVLFPLKSFITDCTGQIVSVREDGISSELREKVSSQAEDAVRSAVCSAVRGSLAGIMDGDIEVSAELETREDGSIILTGVTVTARGTDRAAESIIKSRSARACGLDESKITVKYE